VKNPFEALLSTLLDSGVEFILVGGVAAVVHGSARATFDVDIVYGRSPENLRRIVNALAPHDPYLRGAPPGLPFRLDVQTLERGLNFTLTTHVGDLDLLGEITGGGRYEDLIPDTILVELFGYSCRCLSLRKLIAVKRAAGRPRDLEAIAELEALAEESNQ
jgi:predicted nucleotidyltransferase